ncbi:MAG: ATP-binding protein [Chitinophagaceae bacterium]
MNKALRSILGYSSKVGITAMNFTDRIHPRQKNMVQTKFNQQVHSPSSWNIEYEMLSEEGTYNTFVERGYVVSNAGVPEKLVGHVVDISSLRHPEKPEAHETKWVEHDLSRMIMDAQQKERTFIGHELHDNICQMLTSAKLSIEMLSPVNIQQEEIRDKTREFLVQSLEEIRNLTKELSMPVLSEGGLHAAIEDVVNDLRKTTALNIKFLAHSTDSGEIDDDTTLNLFRIVQVQLNNIIKHANAQKVEVSLSAVNGLVELVISDDGIGFDTLATKTGVGLSSILKRTKVYGGSMKIESSPGNGTRLMVVFPILSHE